VVSLAARFYYLTRLFPTFEILRHVLRAIAPTVPAVAAVLVLRLALEGERTLDLALLELALYLVVTALMTVALERPLLREARSYLRRPGVRPA
jgi:hypothetical protein